MVHVPRISVEETSRAELDATIWSILLSSVRITLSFFFSRLLGSSLFRQPDVPPRIQRGASNSSDSTGKGRGRRKRGQEGGQDLYGTLTLVTGSNVGIGYEIAKEHHRRGSHVLLACRNEGKAKEAKRKMVKEYQLERRRGRQEKEYDGGDNDADEEDRIEIALLDCSSLQNVRQFVEKWKRERGGSERKKTIDYLYLNAGIADKPVDASRFTEEGLELVYVTNHLGPFLLCGLLTPFLSPSARVILTSSAAAFFASFSSSTNVMTVKRDDGGDRNENKNKNKNELQAGFHIPLYNISKGAAGGAYSQSKAMQIIFANQLQAKFDDSRRARGAESSPPPLAKDEERKISASFHPGYVATNIFQALNIKAWWTGLAAIFMQGTALTPEQGAQTALWLGLARDGFTPGAFYDRSNLITLPFYSSLRSGKISRSLWDRWNADAGLEDSDWHF